MRPICIKHFHKVPILLKILILVGISLGGWLLGVGLAGRVFELIVVGSIPLAVIMLGLVLFWNYGIKITSKRVTLLSQDTWKTFLYDEVIYIEIGFSDDSIYGTIKAKNQKAYDFYFSGIDLNRGFQWFHSRFLESDLKITEQFVKRSIEKLSTCEKVKTENRYRKR